MIANKWYCIAQSSTFDSSCGITIYSEGVAVSFTASVRFGSSSINIASCAIDGDILLSIRLRETDNKWCIDLLCNTEFNPTIDITDSPYWEVQNTPAGTGSILAIINDISKEFNTGVKGGESLWQLYNFGTLEKPEYAVVPKDYDGKPIGVVSKTFISFGGHNSGAGESGGTGGGGITSFNVVLNDKKYTSEGDTLTITEKLTPLNSFNTLNSKVSEIEKVLNGIKNLWSIDPDNADTIRTVYNVVVEKAISFGGYGESSGTGGGITTFDVYVGNDGPYPLVNGRVDLPAYPTANLTGYATENWVKEQGYLTQHQDISHLLGKDEAKDIYATIIALNEVSDRVETIESIIGIDSKGNVYIKKKADGTARDFYTYGAISFGGNGESSGSGEVIGSSVQYNASVTSGKLLGTLVIDGVDNKIYAPAIPTKLSAFTNDEGYVTEDWVNNQGFLTEEQDISHLLSKTDAANTYQPKGNYVTESALNGKGYLTQSDAEDTYQPKGNYAELDDLNSYLLISAAKNTYATKTALNNAILAHDELRKEFDALNGLLTDDTSGYIDTWNEVKNFLDGYSESQDLATILSGMNKDIANRATIDALNGATTRISTLETTLVTEQGYIDTLQGYFTSGKANKAIADGDGNNIVATYATKVALNSTNTNLASLSKEFSEFKELVNSLWYLDPDHADTVRTKLNVVVEQAISFGGYGESSGSGGGITTVTKQMVLDALGYTPYDSANPKGYVTSTTFNALAERVSNLENTSKPCSLEDVIGIDENGDVYIKKNGSVARNFYTYGAISFGGYGESSGNGAGLIQVTVKLGDTPYISDGGVVSLPAYPNVPKVLSAFTNDIGYITSATLSNYVTLTTEQTISGVKTFSNGLKIGSSSLSETLSGTAKYLEIDGAFSASSHIKTEGQLRVYKYDEDNILQGGVRVYMSGSGAAINYESTSSDSSLYGGDFYLMNQTDGNLFIVKRSDQNSTVTSISLLYDSAVVCSSPNISSRKLTSQGYFEVSGLNFAITSKETAQSNMTGATFDWIKGTDTLKLNKIYYSGGAIKTALTLDVDGNIHASSKLIVGTTNIEEKSKNNTKYLEIDGNLVVTGAISFGGFGEGGSTSGGITSVTKDMVIDALGYTPYNATNPNGYITASAIPTSLKNPYGLTINNSAGTVQVSYDGSATKSLTLTKSIVGLSNVDNTTDASKYVKGVIDYGSPTTNILIGYRGEGLTSTSTSCLAAYSVTNEGVIVIKDISKDETRTWLGLGSLAYKSSLTFNELTGKPTTVSGYGITDAITTNNIGSQSVNYATSAGSATKLANARTLWGQSFNGTANVSGALSGVNYIISNNTNGYFIGNRNDGLGVTTGGLLLYSYNATPISFFTNTTERMHITAGGYVGIGTTEPSSKLHVVGNIVTTGSITFGSASDRRLKDNIKSMTDKQAVAVLSALNPVTFNWNSTAYELGKLSGTSDGFIADEYEKLIPNSGRDIWANYRAINYERATGYLVKGWQNHETRLEKAERRIKELENELKQYRRA